MEGKRRCAWGAANWYTHTGLYQRKSVFNGGLKTWRWRQKRRWFWLEYYAGTERERERERGGLGVCMLKRDMHATFKCPHADEKQKKQQHWHLLVMLKKQNYANYHHHYMCTSPWNISQLLSERYTRRVQICFTLLLHFFLYTLLVLITCRYCSV